MPSYHYEAVTAAGAARKGLLEAGDRAAALRGVRALGLTPVRVDEGSSGGPRSGKKVPAAETRAFARALGDLLPAGVPLAQALELVSKEARHPAARAAWGRVLDRVRDGAPLAGALAAEEGLFDTVFVAMVRAGEAGGFLGQVLAQVADFMEKQRELRSRVQLALIYPVILVCVAVPIVAFLLVWFIPRFSAIFASYEMDLPLLTRMIQAASDGAVRHGWWLAIAVVALLLVGRRLLKQDAFAARWERLLLRLPAVGAARAAAARVRFCRMFGTLLAAGVPLLSAMQVARETVGSRVLSAALAAAAERLRHGGSLSAALSGVPELLPPSSLASLAVAENSGRLPQELLRQADTADKELDRRMKLAVGLGEPAILLAMAVVIGFIVVGMLLPVFDMWDAVQK